MKRCSRSAFFTQLRGSYHILGARAPTSCRSIRKPSTRSISTPRRHLTLLRGEVGASLVSEFSKPPFGTVRFFAGGDRSVRGFAFNELSPEEPVSRVDEAGNQFPVIDTTTCKDPTGPQDLPNCSQQTAKVGGKNLHHRHGGDQEDLPRNFGVGRPSSTSATPSTTSGTHSNILWASASAGGLPAVTLEI